MPLHLIKLCVGVGDMEELERWIEDAQAGRETLDHTTRMFPKRAAEILAGGSLYWVVKGLILCRQPIAGLVAVRGEDGVTRCRIDFKPEIVPVRPVPKRPFQGWRYLEAADAPRDLPKSALTGSLPETMRRQLLELGLI